MADEPQERTDDETDEAQGDPRDTARWPYWAGAAALAAILVGGVAYALRPGPPPPLPLPQGNTPAALGRDPTQVARARSGIAETLAAAPEYTMFFRALAERFPADAGQTADALVDRWLADPSAASPDRYLSDALRGLRQARGVVAAKAEAAPLTRIFEAQSAMLDGLRAADPRICVDFLYGGAADAFFDFAAKNRPLLAAMAEAGLNAIADGQAKKVERGPPTDADFKALEAALVAAGLGKIEIDALLDGKAPDPPLPDDKMCDAGRAYLKALKTLPEDARLRLYGLAVELMARS
jgi:hypothetical protein